MKLPSLRMCYRLTNFILKSPAYHLCAVYPVACRQQRFCNSSTGVEIGNENENFDDFDESSSHNKPLENVDFNAIAGDDTEKKKNLQVLILELTMMMRSNSILAPKHLSLNDWQSLMAKENKKFRLNYLKYLYLREKRAELKAQISREKREEFSKYLEEKKKHVEEPLTTSSPINYCLQNNSLFYRLSQKIMIKKYNFNLALAAMFGSDVIIDCGYEEYMNPYEIASCARHILYMWSQNRSSNNPFNLICCNMNPNGSLMKFLTKLFPPEADDAFFMNVTEKHYLELYPPQRLVYMTPHCKETLEEYDSDSVYILGAFVDENSRSLASLTKAKKDGLRTAKLPLDKYLNWAQGSKLLPVNTCLRILNDLKDGGCWQYALRHVAVRKQKFQFLDNDIHDRRKKTSPASHVRQVARLTMLRDLNFKKVFKEKKTCNSSNYTD